MTGRRSQIPERSKTLAVGDPAPAFALQTTGGRVVRLSDFRGQNVVLYFYPKDGTPGCIKEACGFRDAAASLTRAGAVVLGVSRDSVASHQRFAEKYRLTFPLLSDPEAAVGKAYGVYRQKTLYGRTYWGIERTTFLIDKEGRIARVFPKVQVDGHVEAILQALRAPSPHPPGGPGGHTPPAAGSSSANRQVGGPARC
jgi:peroxiredoxin Q/BCP